MRFLTRSAAWAATLVLLTMAQPAPSLASDEAGPCQIYCDALNALCIMFGGGGYCKDMREGCHFGCNLRIT